VVAVFGAASLTIISVISKKLLRVALWHTCFGAPLRRGDGEEVPFAGHALEPVGAAVVELES
jgi:hypothetical protein